MKLLTNHAKKEHLIKKHGLDSYMDLDINKISELVSFHRNEFLVTSGTPSKYLYFIISGKLMCFSYTASDKFNCVAFSQNQTLVGEASSLWGTPPAYNVKALSDGICIAIDLDIYRNALLNDLTFMKQINKILVSKINNEGRHSNTLLDPLEVRLAQFILIHSSGRLFTLPLTESADALNTSYRHLLRTMKHFCNLNILSKGHNCYYIQNLDTLTKISDGSLVLE